MQLIHSLFVVRNFLKFRWFKIKLLFWRIYLKQIILSKSSLLVLAFFTLLIGLNLGQWWRASQVEPGLRGEIEKLETEVVRLEIKNDRLVNVLGNFLSMKTQIEQKKKPTIVKKIKK